MLEGELLFGGGTEKQPGMERGEGGFLLMWIIFLKFHNKGAGGPAMWIFLLLLYFEAFLYGIFCFLFNTYLEVISLFLPKTGEEQFKYMQGKYLKICCKY